MRALLLFLIGLIFGGAGGYLAAGGMGDSAHDHASHAGGTHDRLTPWDGPAPALDLMLMPDSDTSASLQINAPGFTFDPANAGQPATQGTGHAHIYVDGEKVMRAYSNWVHLDHLSPGAVIRVTLNANDHSQWSTGDQPIAAEVTVP